VAKSLPRSSGSVAAIKPARDLVEILLGLFRTPGDDTPEVDHVGRALREFLGSSDTHLHEFPILLGSGCAAIERTLSLPSGRDEAGFVEEAEVGGDAGLPKACDLLELVDGKLLVLEEGEETETGWIRKSPQRLQGITHPGRLAHAG